MSCIDLICSECGDRATVSYETLYSAWIEGYGNLSPELKKETSVFTQARCHCGNEEKYNTPMFNHVFQIIFQDFIE